MGKTAASERPAKGIRVLLADDHPVVRHGLRHILAETPDINVVDEAGTGRDVLEKVRAGTCDVLLLDLVMPDGHGMEILETVKREWPALPVLILSMQPVEQYAVGVLRAGAAGYVSKDSAAEELVQAIRKIYAGGHFVTQRVAELLAAELDRTTDAPPHRRLSNREYQVLCLMGRALSSKEIARKLNLSEKTVSTYRARLLGKLQARSAAELVRYAVQHRLAD
jgi:DNA-binding NarL/FixJ family response regulator